MEGRSEPGPDARSERAPEARSEASGEEEPQPPPEDDDALLAECRVETFRAGGPGGQHQNKAESAVRLTHLPTGITATARESRSQHRNRRTALARLREALEERARPEAPRVPTKVPKREKRRRLEAKRKRSETKRLRKPPAPEE